jgi:type I restriction enzyme S subunit
VLSAGKDVDPQFLAYWVRSACFVDEVVARSVGVSYPAINASDIGSLPFPVIPPDEQHTIAAFLDWETERIDILIAKKERQIELLQEKRAALISHAVTKGLDPNSKMKDSGIEWLGEIPAGWITISVKRKYAIQLGKMLQNNPESDKDVSVPYIKALHVLWGKVDTSDLPEMWASPSDVKQFEIRSGDLLVCEGGEAGRAGILEFPPTPCIIQNALHRVRGKNGNIRFLQYVLQAISSAGWFDVLCNKATIAHFTREKLAEIRVPFPLSLDEQHSIADFLDRETAQIDLMTSKIEESITKLREYRTALISAAVTGKIDVRKEVA